MLLPRLSRVGGTKWIPQVVAYCSCSGLRSVMVTRHYWIWDTLDTSIDRERTRRACPSPFNSCCNQAACQAVQAVW